MTISLQYSLKRYESNQETGSHQIREQVGTESDSLDLADAAQAIGVTRRRQRTEKGKAFIAHIRWTDCQSVSKRVLRQMKEIDSLMTNEESVDVVERNLTSFRITVEELKTSAAALLDDLETEDDFNVANVWYVEQSERINEKAIRWISSAKETIEHSLETRSQVSSVHSTTSRRSQASSRSSSRSIARSS